GQSAQGAIDKHTTSKAVSMITPKVVWLISRFLLSQVDTCRPDYHTYRQRKETGQLTQFPLVPGSEANSFQA
ncbi:hypothetical protein, partial [Pseudomonas aeruginosa]|uniref:hypothetical protein n=1 Tax=Pseudomonas aeruginosa TaxID=287 RepID=UPI003967E8A2